MAQPTKRKVTPLPKDPAERFRVVANRRVNAAIASIQSIGSVTGPAYTYTDEQAEAVITALRGAVEDLETRLVSRSAVKSGGFNVGD